MYKNESERVLSKVKEYLKDAVKNAGYPFNSEAEYMLHQIQEWEDDEIWYAVKKEKIKEYFEKRK